ncbi:MAG TPA: hypothetical protein VHE34_15145 [Puia sp.]|uniref:hypothetical protein n=1 Tax=Puia sp. TaxID=2045100 RepID=UPI002C844DA3|nr:hypothetical protein [Puia sp.]HVU96563.1 hypothetical protein [Puia sp.]
MQEATRTIIEDPAELKEHRPLSLSVRGGIALLICFLVGVAAAALLIYTML